MGGREKKLAEEGATGFDALRRRYCRRYGLDPTTPIARRELIRDAAFAQAEADGATPYDRVEAVLTAIYFALGRLAERRGVDMREVASAVGDVERLRPRPAAASNGERSALSDDDETRRAFASTLARAKAVLARRAKEADDARLKDSRKENRL